MEDFRECLYKFRVELDNDYGDRIDALVVMANMMGIDVVVRTGPAAWTVRVYFKDCEDYLFSLIIDLRDKKYIIASQNIAMTALYNVLVTKSASRKISTIGEMLNIAEKMLIGRQIC